MSLKVRLPLDGNLENKGLDLIAVANNGATINTSGKIGQCYLFDGVDDYISLQGIAKYFKGGSTPFSVCFWMYHSGNSRRGVIFGGYGITSTSEAISLEVKADNNFRFWWRSNPDWAPFSITTQTWTHIAVVYDGTKLVIYKDGVPYTRNGTLSTMNASGELRLGRDSRTGATAFNGKINDFRLYDHALSKKEVTEIYRSLILHYKLSDPYLEVNPNIFKWVSSVNAKMLKWNNGIKIGTVSGDAYAKLALTQTLASGETYTLSYMANIADGDTCYFGFYYSSRMNHVHRVYNGYNQMTFSPTINLSSITFDDLSRSNSNPIYIYNIKIEAGNKATQYIPYDKTVTPSISDCSGYERNGTINGTLTLDNDSGRYRKSTVFDGTGAISGPVLQAGAAQSATLWIYIPEAVPYQQIVFVDTPSKIALGFWRYNVIVACATSTQGLFGYSALKLNSWNHIAVVRQTGSANPTLYINGVLLTTTGTDYWSTSGDEFSIGNRLSKAGYPYTGKINDFRLYAAALTQADVKDIMTQTSLDNKGDLFCYEVVENNAIKIDSTGVVESESINEETLTGKQASMLKTRTFKVNEIIEK